MAISPVTQTALVEVKSASIKLTVASSLTEIGSIKISAPIKITAAKPADSSCGGDEFEISFFTRCNILLITNSFAVKKKTVGNGTVFSSNTKTLNK